MVVSAETAASWCVVRPSLRTLSPVCMRVSRKVPNRALGRLLISVLAKAKSLGLSGVGILDQPVECRISLLWVD